MTSSSHVAVDLPGVDPERLQVMVKLLADDQFPRVSRVGSGEGDGLGEEVSLGFADGRATVTSLK